MCLCIMCSNNLQHVQVKAIGRLQSIMCSNNLQHVQVKAFGRLQTNCLSPCLNKGLILENFQSSGRTLLDNDSLKIIARNIGDHSASLFKKAFGKSSGPQDSLTFKFINNSNTPASVISRFSMGDISLNLLKWGWFCHHK